MKLEKDILVISALAICLIAIISFLPSTILRIIIGFPFVIFFPGYTLTAALFPKGLTLGKAERVVLSCGLSLVVGSLLGLLLNYMPWGLSVNSILVSITLLILATAVIAWYRRSRIPTEERFSTDLYLNFTRWSRLSRRDKLVFIIVLVAIFGVIGTLTFSLVSSRNAERFTEFYILGLNRVASDYPEVLAMGEEGKLIVGIVNHEKDGSLSYTIEIVIGGDLNNTIGPLWLDNEEKWESEVGFTARKVGENQKVEFVLYRLGAKEPYRSVYFWIDVR